MTATADRTERRTATETAHRMDRITADGQDDGDGGQDKKANGNGAQDGQDNGGWTG